MKEYILKEGIFTDPGNDRKFLYSDGDPVENYILEVVSRSTDLSVGSAELIESIRDWPSLYHLSPKRADLLRPLAGILAGKRILEIGSGCGAITRYLGELNCQVTSLEGSQRRATITRQRCRDLPNIKVICDNFQDFALPEKFDLVLLIGVLEYSNLFIAGEHPPAAMLEKIRSFLIPGGQLVIAIENKLGIKYLAGAPEDHVDKPYFGIENRYDQCTAVTFGKEEIKKLLEGAGLLRSSFLYPFPDYKLPTVILTEKGISDNSFLKEELLIEKLEYYQAHGYAGHFSTSLAVEAFAQNQLLSHLSNSFLIIAGTDQDKDPFPGEKLAFTYSTQRKKPFCKENIFERSPQDQLMVFKKGIYPSPPEPGLPIRQKIEDEIYYEGTLLFKELVIRISRKGWTVADLRPWADLYHSVLDKVAIVKENQPLLKGEYADLTPFNILLKKGSDVHIFDQEWITDEDLPLYYVLFRGIRFSLGAIFTFSPPAEEVPRNLLELSLAVIRTTFDFTAKMLDECLEKEKKYFSPVTFGELKSFDCGDIRVRGSHKQEQQWEEEVNSYKDEILRLRQQEIQFRSQLDEGRQTAEWYVKTYEKRSLLGLIRDRIRPSK